MGLIKAAIGAIGGTLADQYKEYFYCDSLESNVLVAKGQKRVSGRSSNTKGESNIITNGSIIAVADGQCMMIVEQGKVLEVCAEAGAFKYDSALSPSVFQGNLKDSLIGVAKDAWERFQFGGGAGRDQRIYYFNIKEIMGNKYGTPNPIPFRVVDRNIGLDVDISVRCNGEYSYKIINPMLFYTNVCGNVADVYTRDKIDSMLKMELLTALQPAFAKISDMGIRYSSLPGHTMELTDALNEVLSKKWMELRGITMFSIGVNSISAPKEDEDMIKQLQRNAVMRDPSMAAATLVGAQAQAMQDAAKNKAGAMTGFMGMGMAQQSGGMNAQDLFAMGQQQAAQHQQQMQQQMQNEANKFLDRWKCSCGTENTSKFCMNCGAKKPEVSNNSDTWKCSCGAENTGKFCMNCGAKKPENSNTWKCVCGTENTGKFCMNCGAKKPEATKTYKCNKCGWEPKDKQNPPKFCPECGDIFNDEDLK